jgi:hypothetical protein
MRAATFQHRQSPYVRYGKTPYQYQFKRCSHRRADGRPSATFQQAAGWYGDVCSICNIILKSLVRTR